MFYVFDFVVNVFDYRGVVFWNEGGKLFDFFDMVKVLLVEIGEIL